MTESTQVDENMVHLYGSMGIGTFAGLLAAGISHAVSGQPNSIVIGMVYGMSLYRQHGWNELCALLAMIGTVVVYFAVFESFKLNFGLMVSIGLSLLAFVLFAVYLNHVAAWTIKARAKALASKDSISIVEAMARPLNRTEHWLEPKFADMRAKKAMGSLSMFIAIRPTILAVTSLLLASWLDNTVLVGAVLGMFLFQSIVSLQLLRYLARLSQPSVNVVLATDPRSPILFLRSFALDELPVSGISDSWHGVVDTLLVSRVTFEERLKSTFEDIGPLIAIGRPSDDAAPLGAVREYTDNDSWQQLVLERANVAQLVIMVLDATPGMEWEIDNVSKQVGLRRIVIVLPPGEDIYVERSPAWYARWALLRGRFSFLPEVAKDTVGVLFDAEDRPILVSSSDSSVQKQLAAIKEAWVENVRPHKQTIIENRLKLRAK